MKNINIVRLIVPALLALFLSSCKESSPKKENNIIDKRIITVSITPLQFFADQICQDKWTINTLVPEEISPAIFEPGIQQMKDLEKTTLSIFIGSLPYEEKWISNLKKKEKKLLVLSDKINLLEDHKHGDHIHLDPHVWTSISGAKEIALQIFLSVNALDPKNTNFYKKNYDHLILRLDSLRNSAYNRLEESKQKKFLIYHPSLSYFAHEFQLEQIALEEEGKEPNPRQLIKMMERVKQEDIKTLFIQKQFNSKNVISIANETNINIFKINILGYDYFTEMDKVIEALSK